MATIFTVHGTFASGLEPGKKWWQRGSAFEHDLRTYVSAEDGELRIEPFAWSGHNSENARRAAGKDLRVIFQAEEQKNQRYCLVGHSHGGSVIGHALNGADGTTPNLSSWTTVGTPFIETKRHRIAFFRLGSFARSVYLFAFMIISLYASSLFGEVYRPGLIEYVKLLPSKWIDHIYELSLFIVPAAILVLLTRYSKTKLRDAEYFKSVVSTATVANKPLSLWHASDEAIQALQSARYINLNALKNDKIASAISALSILMIPTVVILVAQCDHCMWALTSFWTASSGPLGRVHTVPPFSLDRFTLLIAFYLELPFTLLRHALGSHLYYVEDARPILVSGLLFFSALISLSLLFAVSWLAYMAMTGLGHAVSHRLSMTFNAFIGKCILDKADLRSYIQGRQAEGHCHETRHHS